MEELKEFDVYAKELDRCGLSVWKLETIRKNGTIILTTERYEKLGRKQFPKKPTNKTVEVITARALACYMTSCNGFKDRITLDYTSYGYIATRLTCVSPDGEMKIIRKFAYEPK